MNRRGDYRRMNLALPILAVRLLLTWLRLLRLLQLQKSVLLLLARLAIGRIWRGLFP